MAKKFMKNKPFFLSALILTVFLIGCTPQREAVSSYIESSVSTKETFEIYYILDGGVNHPDNPSQYTEEDEIVFLPPTKEGYSFVGWFDANGTAVTMVKKGSSGTLTLFARWSLSENKLSVISNDSSKGEVEIVSGSGYSFDTVHVRATAKSNCKFKEWRSGGRRLSIEPDYWFTMPPEDYCIEAIFRTFQEDKALGATPTISSDGQTVTYGLYPSKNVDDAQVANRLNELGSPTENGWYLLDGRYYAKKTTSKSPMTYDYTFENGVRIEIGETYWFLCEPLKWDVIRNNGDGSYYLASQELLDRASYFKGNSAEREDIYESNYEHSDMRQWLNQDFYETAFFFDNRNIQTTLVKNGPSTMDGLEQYRDLVASPDTEDKVFLPSFEEMTSLDYGFIEPKEPRSEPLSNPNSYWYGEKAFAKLSDWAKVNTVTYETYRLYTDYPRYPLRSPYVTDSAKYDERWIGLEISEFVQSDYGEAPEPGKYGACVSGNASDLYGNCPEKSVRPAITLRFNA